MRRGWDALCFVAGGVLAFAALFALSEAVDPVYPQMRARMAVFHRHRTEAEAITVGNSHSRAIDFGTLGLRGIHFWSSGQDAFMASFLARYAEERAPRLRYVFVAATYGLPQMDQALITSIDFMPRRREMYARIGGMRYIPGDRTLWVSGRLAPVVRTDHWQGVLQAWVRPRTHVLPNAEGRIPEPLPPTLSGDSLARHGAAAAARHLALAAETLAADPATPARAIADLDALARQLRRRGILLVLYTPPYHEVYGRHVWSGGGELRRALRPLLARNDNAVWLDFSSHPGFVRRADFYVDSDHLNERGARAFSRLLRTCLHAPSRAATPQCPFVAP